MPGSDQALLPLLTRIAEALERLAPPAPLPLDFSAADAFVWHPDPDRLEPVPAVNRVDIMLLQGIERQRETLLDNTRRFAAGLPANNALLWGARGTGKSSLVKAVHAAVCGERPDELALVEIHREDIPTLPRLLARLKGETRRFILFCDDLSFDHDDAHYKSLKAVLDGGIEGRPDNVVFYATSNRRHLMPREMIDNERSTAINPGEAVEEKVSLSDRFGLWLGFHNCDQDTYFAMIDGYVHHFGLDIPADRLRAKAVEWSVTRGSRSGRVAWQFIQDLAGRLGTPLR
ncbi:ATP-binding protein [Azospirillum picis]|uniref:AAA+ superfamily ATPase n=1 Tax=Azospirillum picis TaxID=488438 RepID=A0ABU0MG99_9PROT|nr:ATP-binding protein [Azospirillum picis]MBP2298494.1 putative AAA+ superfamily ATPase [Azospirillum picis]MDQ0532457.1 putative AAA+ superfamily ATPase [Azospirillum picis]